MKPNRKPVKPKDNLFISEQNVMFAHLKSKARRAPANGMVSLRSLTIWVRLEKVFDVLRVQVPSGRGRSSR